MQHIVMYVTGIYSYLAHIGFETQIFNSEKLPSGPYVYWTVHLLDS